jgi:four helix bundle protein
LLDYVAENMFLQLKHKNLEVYLFAERLVIECYRLANTLPTEEKWGLSSQIRRASVSVILNIAEGCSRVSKRERNRFLEIARSSLSELDTALSIGTKLGFLALDSNHQVGQLMNSCFAMLSKMIISP